MDQIRRRALRPQPGVKFDFVSLDLCNHICHKALHRWPECHQKICASGQFFGAWILVCVCVCASVLLLSAGTCYQIGCDALYRLNRAKCTSEDQGDVLCRVVWLVLRRMRRSSKGVSDETLMHL